MEDVEERLLAAEAELLALRRYMRALISLLPYSPKTIDVSSETQRTLDSDAKATGDEKGAAIAKATTSFGWHHLRFLELLSGTKIDND